ncbi:MAG TPA: glycosyltransferase [Steroidobacteraceae bacterium]|jgi:glycosyltransferase involved in cell wall biosynthesis
MDKRPGLLFIVNSLGVGGAEKQVVTLLNRLDRSRFRLHLAYLKPAAPLLAQLEVDRLDELLCCNAHRGIDWSAVGRLRRLTQRRHIDAIISTNTYSMLYGSLARTRAVHPQLATVFHTTLIKGLKAKAQMLLYRSLFKRCDLLIYVCENQRDYWRDGGLGGVNDTVVHNGIDVRYFGKQPSPTHSTALRKSLGFAPEDYVVGICSALRPEKAHADLLVAIAGLREQGIPVKALFIGDGPERAAIESNIEALGLRGWVQITGVQSDVRPFIGCCDVMALVSRSIETFSLAALESMAAGKPLILTDIGGASEQVIHGQNGFLYEPGDIEALQLHLTSLRSQDLRAQMGASGATRVRRMFTVDSMTAGFEARIDELLVREKASNHDWNMSTLHK